MTMKSLMIICAIITIVNMSAANNAHATDGGENERTPHYLSATPESSAQATKQFREGMAQIEEVIQKDALVIADLELIHEVTYSLESALKGLEAEYADSKQFEALKEAVEEVHLASEHHKEQQTRSSFASVQQLSHIIVTQ